MIVTKDSLYVFEMPENHEHHFEIDVLEGLTKKDGGELRAGPFGTMDLADPHNADILDKDNGWAAANSWIRLNDRVAWNFLLKGKPIWDQIETITSGTSFFDDTGTSWHRWLVLKWPEKLPPHFIWNPKAGFIRELLRRFDMGREHAAHAGQHFADVGNAEIDKDRQLIHMTQMGGLDI
ncbi:hypothetical protein KAR91_77655 [Candidatus Pacearchaeota archaeon]|nr:hypothetical protein [Candidatus Pacearchaeota archaeon]